MVESLTLFEVVGQQLCRRQDFLIVLGELALVEVAVKGNQLLGSELPGFLVSVLNDDFLAVIPPILDGLAMLQLHRLGLGEVLVALWHIQTVEPCPWWRTAPRLHRLSRY